MAYRTSILGGVVLAAVVLVAGCQTRTVTTAESNLTVSGPIADVERFARLQATRSPALETTPLKPTGPGTGEIEIVLGDDVSGDDVARIGREAIAAGLTYSFSNSRTTSTNVS